VIALALVGSTVYGSKQAFGRSMPAVDVLHSSTGHAFPSGHVATAVVLWGLLAWLAAEHGLPAWITAPLGVLRWLAPALTFGAMVLLDYHWLTDVVGGLALGLVLLRVLHEIDARALRDWRGGEHRRDAGPGSRQPGAGGVATARPGAEPAAAVPVGGRAASVSRAAADPATSPAARPTGPERSRGRRPYRERRGAVGRGPDRAGGLDRGRTADSS
jgi:hypothetical protein